MGFEVQPLLIALTQRRNEQSIMECNDTTAEYGLVLSAADVRDIVTARDDALTATGRVEFGSIVERLIYKFCDSPYIMQSNYTKTICELTEIFYIFKNETLDAFTDDQLLDIMKEAFDGSCAGSTELLASRELNEIARNLRYGMYGALGDFDAGAVHPELYIGDDDE